MPSNEEIIIISGGRGANGHADGEYWAEYEGRRVKLTGWRLLVVRRVAAWVYRYFGA